MEDSELYAAYFKKDSEYYLKKLEQYRNGNKYVFNVYAFFFGFFWFMYRKMYLEAIIMIMVIFAEGLLEELITENMGETVQSFVSLMTTFIISTITAMLSNALYIRKAEREIANARLKAVDRQTLIIYLREKGGVSYWVWIAVVVTVAGIAFHFYNLNKHR